jgi:hypothetical protein
LSINITRYVQRYHMAKYTSRGNAIKMTRQIFDKATSHLYNGYRVSFLGVKRPGRDVDHLPHPAPTLKKKYSYTSTSPLGFHGLFKGEFTLPYPSTCVCRRVTWLFAKTSVLERRRLKWRLTRMPQESMGPFAFKLIRDLC